jgi:hypothetical protein
VARELSTFYFFQPTFLTQESDVYDISILSSPVNEFLNQLVDLYEIQYGGNVTEGDLDDTLCNPVPLIIPKWWTLKLPRWIQSLQRTWDHEVLYADTASNDER